MNVGFWRKPLILIGVFVLLWLGMKYIFWLIFPFLAGTLLAFGAEPLVRLLWGKLRFSRTAATAVGVTVTLILFGALLTLLGALAVREIGVAMGALPDLGKTAQQGLTTLRTYLVDLAQKAPRGVQGMMTQTVDGFFQNSSAVMTQVTSFVPDALSAVIKRVPDGALGIGTAVLSGFMISLRLPELRSRIGRILPKAWQEAYLPKVRNMRKALGQWLKAQLKLSAVTFLIVATGLLLLRVRLWALWAALIALVDAAPMLGTGAALIPWAAICFLQGDSAWGAGLLVICAVAIAARTALEPRLLGKHLGLDPLATLAALYLGYRLWGISGMVLTPLIATAAKALCKPEEE